MAEIKRTALFGKLNSLAYKAIESATVLLQDARQPVCGAGPLAAPDSATAGLRSSSHRQTFGIDPSRLAADLTASLDKLPRGATAISDFSPHLEEAVERGWVYASLLYNDSQVRTGYLIIGILKTPGLAERLRWHVTQFGKIKVEELSDDFRARSSQGSPEDALTRKRGSAWRWGCAGRNERRDGSGRDGEAGSTRSVLHRSYRKSAQRRNRSHRRPRRRDPTNRRHPHAPPAEQSDSHRRSRRWQNGGSRRFCITNRVGRRAAGAQRRRRFARSIWACCKPARA